MDMFNVLTVKDTRGVIDDNFTVEIGSEFVHLNEATGRILKNDVVAPDNVPDFRRSAVDGYAVYSRDVYGASESMQSILDLKGEVLMGQEAQGEISLPGQCYYVPTGGMIPKGADSVIMIEYTEKLDESTILASKPSSPGENVIEIGEDIKKEEVVIKKGKKLRAYEIGVLSSLGFLEAEVCKKPCIGIISTGDEVVNPKEQTKLGQVRDINTYLLYSLINESGCKAIEYGLVKDEYDSLKDTVEKAVSECNIVLISGGSSVGKKDNTVKVINDLGGEGVLVHGISIKPGKPTIIGKYKEKIIYGLPGHPLACAIVFQVMVKYYIDKLTGHKEQVYPLTCKFKLNYHKAKGREEYLPVTIEEINGELTAYPVFGKSGLITGFSRAWGYIIIERNEEGIKEGQFINVYKL
ncbi:MAG: molybdopterin molybdotransferase MoeA [Sedimentibacter sp.]|uniref:molybdopterin molybdotransferase MoeA n=1 Tax=Sedimentibacter sp. TaxID=1960295 RepID=UPI002981AF36|nr:molybdopterin molybdotransferase MoeA [Sedimentibacter sp.]MDW5298957.1 molybdopterin molybdotransferase MoeA [Sedimentibacter sp.]